MARAPRARRTNQPLAAEDARPHLPGLLAPKYRVTDTGVEDRVEARRTSRLQVGQAWKAFKSTALSSFAFVDAMGLFFAVDVFGEALDGTGDAFEMLGFSSVRRQHVRMQHLKGFDEPWSAAAQARVGAIKPGYYTRMGAALRLATRRLSQRDERQRLLLILTDGKPNDLDVYEKFLEIWRDVSRDAALRLEMVLNRRLERNGMTRHTSVAAPVTGNL